MILKKDISENEFKPYFKRYFDLTPEDVDLVFGLRQLSKDSMSFYHNIPLNKLDYAYEKGKWTIKEVLQHIIDTERIFMYRSFRVGRMDPTGLAGFDQDDYIPSSGASKKNLEQLLVEYHTTREAFLSILEGFGSVNLSFVGEASGGPISARSLGYLTWGHELWHMKILKERYL